jgi:hypothetical protein
MALCPAVGDSGAEVADGKISSSTCVASSYIYVCQRGCGGRGWGRKRGREGGRERERGRGGGGERAREKEQIE